MQVTTTMVTKLFITGVENLDPITVFLEDHEPGRGSITIRCHAKSWAASWGAMGKDRKVAQFVRSCGADYLIGAMVPMLQPTQFSGDELIKVAKRSVINRRRGRNGAEWNLDDLDKRDARRLWSDIEHFLPNADSGPSLSAYGTLLTALFGDEWWHTADGATEPNPDWQYLERILDAVQVALAVPPGEQSAAETASKPEISS